MPNKETGKLKEKKPFNILAVILAVVLLVTFVGGYFYIDAIKDMALNQYIAHRTCDFIQIGDFHVAKCNDNTMWSVTPFVP